MGQCIKANENSVENNNFLERERQLPFIYKN